MIYRILTKVFREPWLIKPETHYAIQKVLAAKVNQDGIEPGEPANQTQESIPAVPSVAVIPVFGIIGKHLSGLETVCGGFDVDALAASLKAARDDDATRAILLWFNTPGGTVTGVSETAQLIAQIDAIKPVYAFTDSLCASAGYWLASQCRAIFATESADVGSVGVYIALLDESRALEDAGIKVNTIFKGDFKLAGASFKPLSDAERAMFQADVDKIYSRFTAAVTSKRGIEASNLQGQCFDGETATQLGFVDGLVADIDEAIALTTSTLTHSQ